MAVEVNLLARHGLGLDYAPRAGLRGDAGDDLPGVGGIMGQVHRGPGCLGLGLELLIKLFQLPHGRILGRTHLGGQTRKIHPRETGLARSTVVALEAGQGLAQKAVVQGALEALVILTARGAAHDPSSSSRMCN